MIAAISFFDRADRWLRDLEQMGPQAFALLIPFVIVLLLEGKMLQDGLVKAKVEKPSFFLSILVAVISVPPCTIIGLMLSFIPVLGWIAGLALSFALVGGLCALFFRCTWGQGFYAAFWWWLYHLIFLLVIGVVLVGLLILGLSLGR